MNRKQLIEKITKKKEFSQLPPKDVSLVLDTFDKQELLDEEKVKLTRDLLRKMYTAFVSNKLLNLRDKDPEWFLNKHLSTKERLSYYKEVYDKCFEGLKKNLSVIDLGCGVNGFSYPFFKKLGFDVNYVGIEAVGQLVGLQNNYFKRLNGKVIHESLFNLEKVKEIINNEDGARVAFLFKTLDSLEMLKRDYSKKLLKEIVPLVDRVVVSFATRSLIRKTRFRVGRNWIVNFISENFEILEDIEIGCERYIVFCK